MIIRSDTWGRMDYAEAFSLMTYRVLMRFSVGSGLTFRHFDGSMHVGSAVAQRAARVVWADRAEAAFALEERQVKR